MAQWTVSDELDKRVRAQVGDDDAEVNRYVESLVEGRLSVDEDPAWRAEVVEEIRRGIEDIDAGRTYPAKQGLRDMAQKYGLTIPE